MKILNKLPRSNPNLHLDLIKNGWVPMKEPKNLISAILLSIPLMIVAAIISIGVINIFSTISLSGFGLTADSISITINLGIIFYQYTDTYITGLRKDKFGLLLAVEEHGKLKPGGIIEFMTQDAKKEFYR